MLKAQHIFSRLNRSINAQVLATQLSTITLKHQVILSSTSNTIQRVRRPGCNSASIGCQKPVIWLIFICWMIKMQFCALNKDYLPESSSLHIVGFMSADTPVNAYVVQAVHEMSQKCNQHKATKLLCTHTFRHIVTKRTLSEDDVRTEQRSHLMALMEIIHVGFPLVTA